MSTPMHQVVSSTIGFIGYEYDTQELYITFTNGTTYKYDDVPELVYKELFNNSSIGKYYSSYIRGHYTSTKI